MRLKCEIENCAGVIKLVQTGLHRFKPVSNVVIGQRTGERQSGLFQTDFLGID